MHSLGLFHALTYNSLQSRAESFLSAVYNERNRYDSLRLGGGAIPLLLLHRYFCGMVPPPAPLESYWRGSLSTGFLKKFLPINYQTKSCYQSILQLVFCIPATDEVSGNFCHGNILSNLFLVPVASYSHLYKYFHILRFATSAL